MTNATVMTEGFDDFEDALITLASEFGYTDVNKKVLIPAVRDAMQSVLPVSQSLARADTGSMRASIKVDARRPNERDRQSKYIDANDAAIAVLSAKQSAVSLGEEFGTANKGAHPFLRPALESNQASVVSRLSTILAFKLDSYKARKAKKDRPV